MARRFIRDLQPGERIEDQVFAIRSKDLRTTTQGSLYIHAILTDRSGEILARQWQASEEGFKAMPEGGFLCFKGSDGHRLAQVGEGLVRDCSISANVLQAAEDHLESAVGTVHQALDLV